MLVDAGIQGHDADFFQAMTLTHGVVVKVVGGRDLHAACAKSWVNIVIGNDRQRSADQGQPQCFSNQVPIAFIFGIYCNRNITEHGLWPGGGNDKALAAIRERIVD